MEFQLSIDAPVTVWMTGLSGSGKTTLARKLKTLINQPVGRAYILDGDVLRTGLCSDLGYSLDARAENIRRAAESAKLLNNAGVTVIAALISPLSSHRMMAREIIGGDRFIETYISADFEACERRDPKSLYKKARLGLIPEFTGLGSPYEVPSDPEIKVDTERMSVDESANHIARALNEVIVYRSTLSRLKTAA